MASTLSAIAPEIIEDIILRSRAHTLYDDSGGMIRWQSPISARLVCRRWNGLVVNDPRMWRHIYVTQSGSKCVKLHLERSKALPLMIWVKIGALDNVEAHSLLVADRHRWEGLFFENRTSSYMEPNDEVVMLKHLDVGQWTESPLPILRYLHVGGNSVSSNDGRMALLELPSLEFLSFAWTVPGFKILGAVDLGTMRFKDCFFSKPRFSDYLAMSSDSLRSLLVENVVFPQIQSAEWPSDLVFTMLQDMQIRSQAYPGFTRAFFTHVRFPALRTMTYDISTYQTMEDATVPMDFPCLSELDVGGHEMPHETLAEFVRASPILANLVLPTTSRQGTFESILELLSDYSLAMGEGCSIEHITGEFLQVGEARKLVEAITSIRCVSLRTLPRPISEVAVDTLAEDLRWLDGRLEKLCWI